VDLRFESCVDPLAQADQGSNDATGPHPCSYFTCGTASVAARSRMSPCIFEALEIGGLGLSENRLSQNPIIMIFPVNGSLMATHPPFSHILRSFSL
jgi:hypothetical protein